MHDGSVEGARTLWRMGKAGAARKLAAAAAYGGGGLSVVGASLYGVLRAEAGIARRLIGNADSPVARTPRGWYGKRPPGPALRSHCSATRRAAGYGVEIVEETPGAHLASGCAQGGDAGSTCLCRRVGAQTRDLPGQIDRALSDRARTSR